MNCPRCGAPLRPEGPNRKWLQYFECDECCLAFELVIERRWAPRADNPRARFIHHMATLQQGRTARQAGWMRGHS
jgi:transposase-like protein